MNIPAREAVILYKTNFQRERGDHPDLPDVVVVRRGTAGTRLPLHGSVGSVFSHWHEAKPAALLVLLFVEFNTLTVREGIDPKVVHQAFLNIPEYRQLIADDIAGAEDEQSAAVRDAMTT